MYFEDGDINAESLVEAAATVNDQVIMNKKSYQVQKTITKEDGTTETKTVYLIPIASGELVVRDQSMELFDNSQYDLICLVNELIKTIEFKSMFHYAFPYKRYLSLVTIYTMGSFFDSIGNMGSPASGGDRWVVPGGRKGSTFKNWDKNYIFFNLTANSPGYLEVKGTSHKPAGANPVKEITRSGFAAAISKQIQPPKEFPTK